MKTVTFRLPQSEYWEIRQAVASFDFKSPGELARIAVIQTIRDKRNVKLKSHVSYTQPCNMVIAFKLPATTIEKLVLSYCKPRGLTLSEWIGFVVIEWLKTLYKDDKRQQKRPCYVQWRQDVGPSLRQVYNS